MLFCTKVAFKCTKVHDYRSTNTGNAVKNICILVGIIILQPLVLFSFADKQISTRHLLLKDTIGTLEMENEAYIQMFYMSWAFFPAFVLVGVLQLILAYLYNKHHPFSIILSKDENSISCFHPTFDMKTKCTYLF